MVTCKIHFIGGEQLNLVGETAEFVYNKLKLETHVPGRLFILMENKKELVIFTDKVTYVEKKVLPDEAVDELRKSTNQEIYHV
ncbi:hypothetical protein [Lihuaxuella thermophila]|uniref:Uncharacterized protein n=1 Tax=Lihuaxuella thermophila TaxID=1173111 RepID=A0A1H8DXV5_9BACL|nr:hypothetical protein [Lihuaxuella thermophila]SEN11377.1 hypothetical protein SAMN05444955_1063 [Lihuaxuella thermophila]